MIHMTACADESIGFAAVGVACQCSFQVFELMKHRSPLAKMSLHTVDGDVLRKTSRFRCKPVCMRI